MTTVIPAPPSSVTDLRDPAATRALVADARPDVVLPSRRARPRRAVVGGPDRHGFRQRRDRRRRARGRSRRGARRGRRGRRLGRGVRAAGDRSDDRVAPAAPAEPVRRLEGVRRPARPLLRRRVRAARDPRARVQPRRPGAGADLRDRQLRAPVRRGPRGRRGPDPDRHRQPGHPARLHRRARRRARLPHARRARRARASTTSARA